MINSLNKIIHSIKQRHHNRDNNNEHNNIRWIDDNKLDKKADGVQQGPLGRRLPVRRGLGQEDEREGDRENPGRAQERSAGSGQLDAA